MSERLEHLQAGERIMYGGDRVTTVSPALAAAFQPGDRLVVVHETGDLLHIPAAEHAVASEAVGAATQAFTHLAATTDEQISDFFHRFAALLADDTVFAPIAAANEADVASALQRGRATGRLTLSPKMRADMIDGLRVWRDIPTRRRQMVGEVRHDQWTVEQWRDPLGVVGFVFEGRPNVFANAMFARASALLPSATAAASDVPTSSIAFRAYRSLMGFAKTLMYPSVLWNSASNPW